VFKLPLFTTSIQNQQTSSSSGRYSYPQIGQPKKDSVIYDEFVRTALNPTGAITLYTVSGTGTPTNAMQFPGVDFATSAVINDTCSARTTGLTMSRVPWDTYSGDKRSNLIINFVFYFSNVADVQSFIGLHLGLGNAMTALPTSSNYSIGLKLDTTVNGRIYFSTSDGSTLVSTDTGVTADGSLYRLEINMNGNTTATLSLYTGTALSNVNTLLYTFNATNILNDGVSYDLQFFTKTLALAIKGLLVYGWQVESK